MNKPIKKVVIVGGGTAGWMSAALLKKVMGSVVDIELIESEEIGRIGVGEATIPPIRYFNQALGIDEAEFLRETKASIKLAIKFENWRVPGEGYFHTFGGAGKNIGFCAFHHFWLRAKTLGDKSSLWDYDLNYLCAASNKFAPINSKDPALEMQYAFHFDASLYANFLRKFSENIGVIRTEGLIERVTVHPDSGAVDHLILKNGRVVHGDLFVDCSGMRALLIQQTLGTGYEDWSHWLPCDRAIAVPSERLAATLPYTRSIAHSAGWQWRIPLQHRNGNGIVYSSNHYSQDEAAAILLNNLDSKALAEPNFISFKTGRRLKQWNKNVIAVGLSSGFLEPLESTSIHLIQSAIVRLIKLFPHAGIDAVNVAEYNRQSKTEFEQVRDFIILHYHVNERTDSQFWRDLRNMEIPESLTHKINLFRATGKIFREQDDLFLESSWLQVMLGQGIVPRDYHALADNLSEPDLMSLLANMKKIKQSPLEQIPSHDEFLRQVCAR
ncbi:tryptophan halogenase [Cellvibrio zantedeschiae]|uniref:Tryptophan halogenase n=1 Tax=Cellvibrio zantedeschiae TaxID=1237077 RepID=A0ABQ3AMM8_9GAMM|nr:tryptophan halogenase family protein [Cellvibrio zantedeschiae]GGY61175.1 tryptophan halogenase [Cellvibrio zantedeschiae]